MHWRTPHNLTPQQPDRWWLRALAVMAAVGFTLCAVKGFVL